MLFRKELSYKELEILNRTLYFYFKAGYSFEKSLINIKRKIGFSLNIRFVLNNILKDINNGKSIYTSFVNTKRIPNYMLNIIKVGEETGGLEKSFKELWNYYSWRRKSKKEFIDNISYPISIFILSIILFLVIILYFIPEIYALMKNIGGKESYKINKMMCVNRFIINYGFFIVCSIFTFIVIFTWFLSSNKKYLYLILSKSPIIRKIYLKRFNINFFNALYVILSNGISLTKGIEILISAEKNYLIKRKLNFAINEIKNGCSLVKSLENTKLFSKEDLDFMITGEESGELERSFKTIATLKEEELKNNINIFLKCIQPIMIICLGFMIFNIIYSSVIPIMDMMEKMQ